MTDSHAADVQAELQQYLNSKNINALFISIVESLLIEKPANPIAYIIEYLHKQYPDQAKPAIENLSGMIMGAAGAAQPKAEAKGGGGAKASATAAKKAAKEDNSDEDEDDVADIPQPTKAPAAKGSRRTSVSSESMDPAKLKAQMSQVNVQIKTPDVHAELLRIVSKSPLLRTLDPEQKDSVIKAFSGPLEKAPGDNIIIQGDIGDVFYLLEAGTVDVYIKKKGAAEESKVHQYKPGDAFGELAIMYNAPRAATCRASSNCKLWALDRISFKAIVVAAAMQKRETYKGFLQQVPILSTLTEMEIMTLADSLFEETFTNDTVICNQGDEGNFFYIIKDGAASCSQSDGNGNNRVVASLKTGNYFGEIALLTSKPRQATVRADGKLVVLSLDRATFIRVLGSMEDILKRNMEQYTKYTAANI